MADILLKMRAGGGCIEPCKAMEARAGCECAEAADEIERRRQEAADAKDDALRLHRDKMRLLDALLEIKCNESLTGAEAIAIAIATRALEQLTVRQGTMEREKMTRNDALWKRLRAGGAGVPEEE